MYHQHDKETGREDKKYAVAQKYGYRLIKIIEVPTVQEMRIESDKIFIAVYGNANRQIKSQIITIEIFKKLMQRTNEKNNFAVAVVVVCDWVQDQEIQDTNHTTIHPAGK